MTDVVVVGAGPNGLGAAVRLARGGASVLVLEGDDEIGGGTRSSGTVTLPGFLHDVCSAVHPMAHASPWFRQLPLGEHGLTWIHPPLSVAHPLDDGPAVLLQLSLADTAAGLDDVHDGRAYGKLLRPLLGDPHGLLDDVLGPLGVPRHPWRLLRFGLLGLRSAQVLAARFRGPRARALLAGCAAHSILPLDRPFTGAMGLLFLLLGHVASWPIVAGGSMQLARALASLLRAHGGRIETGRWIRNLADLPPARLYLFDTSPAQLARIAGPVLPAGYLRRLERYEYGPGVFKLDFALDGPIPWRDPRCLEASTVHIGGTFEQIARGEGAAWRGEHADQPFVLLCQQSQFDPTRAPAGRHTGYAYCHVPARSDLDITDTVERQIERFAPGFRARILARQVTRAVDLERRNPNDVGGAITGGAAIVSQLFTRPVARWNPYATPNPRVLLCSSSTPPGGGVHGMCGYHAAGTALRRLQRFPISPLR